MLQRFHILWRTGQNPSGLRLSVLSFFKLELEDDVARHWTLMYAIIPHLREGALSRVDVFLPERRQLNLQSKFPQRPVLPSLCFPDVLRCCDASALVFILITQTRIHIRLHQQRQFHLTLLRRLRLDLRRVQTDVLIVLEVCVRDLTVIPHNISCQLPLSLRRCTYRSPKVTQRLQRFICISIPLTHHV